MELFHSLFSGMSEKQISQVLGQVTTDLSEGVLCLC